MTAAEFGQQYMRVSNAAEALRVDAATVYREVARGVLRGATIDGVRFVERESVERAIRDRSSSLITA